MIKVPATAEGIPAIRQLISEAINVNVTLLFAQSAYEEVGEAFLVGLEDRQARGLDIRNIASVASFFISRIDTAVDGLLTAKIQTATDASERHRLTKLRAARSCKDYCGRAPAQKTRTIATFYTSRS
jgi:transaldolase/glucose-6-phosphate isomerase